MVSAVKDFFRSISDPVDKLAEDLTARSTGKKSSGVSAIPDTTSKKAVEKNAEKSGVIAWLTSWFSPDYAFDSPVLNKVSETLPLQPQLPPPSSAARKLVETLRETNIKTWLAQEDPGEGNTHKLFIALYLAQRDVREEAARSQQNRFNNYRLQLKATQVTQKMLNDEIKSSEETRKMVGTIHKVCSAVAISAFVLSSIAFVVGATGGTAIPVLGWIATNASLGTAVAVAKGTAAVGAGTTSAASTYLQQKSEKMEADLTASIHQSDAIDLEMKALQQWFSHVFSAISHLYTNLRQVVQKRHEATKTQE